MTPDKQLDPWAPPPVLGPPQPAPPAEAEPVREDLRVPWGGRDVLLFFGVAAAGLLFTAVLFGAGLLVWNFAGGPGHQELLENPTAKTALAVGQQTLLNALLVAFIVVVVRGRSRQAGAGAAGFWRSIGWRPVRFAGGSAAASFLLITLAGMVLAVVLQLLSALKPPEGPVPIQEFFRTRESVLILMVAAVGMAPLVEELVFRGFLYPVLARRLGMAAGVILTGALFGLTHVPQLRGAWWQIALLFAVGVVFTWVRAASGSVAAAFFLHLGYNAMQMLSVVFSSDGLRSFPPAGS